LFLESVLVVDSIDTISKIKYVLCVKLENLISS